MANSPLVTYTRLSPNHSGKRTHTIDRITPHAVVGQFDTGLVGIGVFWHGGLLGTDIGARRHDG